MNFIYISENLTVFLHRTDGCFFCCFKAFVTTKWPVLKHAEFTTNSVHTYNTFIHYTLIAVKMCSELEHFSNKTLDFSVPCM